MRWRKRMVARGAIWQHARMRQGWLWAVSLAALVLVTACDSKPVATSSSEDVLVLDVGGAQPSLRAALVALGRSVEPPRELSQRIPDRSSDSGFGGQKHRSLDEDGGGARRDVVPKLDPQAGDPPLPQPAPPIPDLVPESPWVIVKLGKGETPIHIAKRCLGDGRRFREVMQWNGWSERDTHYLQEGQDVKIKRSELR